MSAERQTVVDWLLESATVDQADIERYTAEIEDLEGRLVRLRDRRDEARLRIVETRAAASLLENAGLKVEKVNGQVTVSVKRAFVPETPA